MEHLIHPEASHMLLSSLVPLELELCVVKHTGGPVGGASTGRLPQVR